VQGNLRGALFAIARNCARSRANCPFPRVNFVSARGLRDCLFGRLVKHFLRLEGVDRRRICRSRINRYLLVYEYSRARIIRRLAASERLARAPSFHERDFSQRDGRASEGAEEREREKERGIQSGRACSADWYQWRQIELAGDRWSSPAVTQSYGGVHNVFPRARCRASILIRFSFYIDIRPESCLLRTLRSQVHSVPLHLHACAFFCECDGRAIVRRTSIISWRSFHDSFVQSRGGQADR